MIGALVQIALLVGVTHMTRALIRRVGPRWGGLCMGVPTTTALVLVGAGIERGLDDATAAAEACLAGLAAASSLPVAYARAASMGWRSRAAGAAAVAAYGVVAAGLWWLPGVGAVGCLAVAGAGVILACLLARRVGYPGETAPGLRPEAGALESSCGWGVACRSAVPTVHAVSIGALRALAGTSCAGRFMTFPGTSLAVLVTTHLESGPVSACRLASAMPVGNLGMLAFLTAFRFGCPGLGLGWGTAIGYAAAVAVLAAAGRSFGPGEPACGASRAKAQPRPGSRRRARQVARVRQRYLRRDPAASRSRRPRAVSTQGRGSCRRRRVVSPRVEILSG